MHSLFIQQDIDIMFIDDFCNLPSERVWGNVYCGLTPAVDRHDALWAGAH